MLTRRTLIVTAAAVLAAAALPVPALAQNGAQHPAGRFVETMAEHTIATVADRSLTEPDRIQRFRELFIHAFDLPEVSAFILGRHWRTATPDQQKRFMGLFEEMSLLTWSQRFKDYQGETLDVLGVVPSGEYMVVQSRVNRAAGPPIPVDWYLTNTGSQGYKIFDIAVEGVRMALAQRSEYGSALRNMGNSMDRLLDAMARKVQTLKR